MWRETAYIRLPENEQPRAPADGYTLFHANINNSLNDLLQNDSCCKLGEALVPITMLTSSPLVMVVPPSLGVRNLTQYQAWVKANPDKASFASGGSGDKHDHRNEGA